MPKIVTIFERRSEFESDGFYVFDAKKKVMMCKFCNVRIDWERRDTCVKHVKESVKHKQNKDKASAGPSRSNSRQVSIQDSMTNAKRIKLDRTEFIQDTTKSFMSANIPLEKLDHPSIRDWLNKYVEGAGDLPQSDRLRKAYVPNIKREADEAMKNAVKDQHVAILCDETTDRKGNCVFAVLVKVLSVETQALYLGGIKFLENANAKECSRAILEVLAKYDICYDNVTAIVTDSARYMTASVKALTVTLSDDLLHVQCYAHKLNLIVNMWSSGLPELNLCITNSKMAFLNTRKRKHKYRTYLQEKYTDQQKKPNLFPMPVLTRWNSWQKSVQYISEYLEDLVSFFQNHEEGGAAIDYFKTLNNSTIAIILVQATFLVETCQQVCDAIEVLEGSSYPYIHRLAAKLSDIQSTFQITNSGTFGDKTTECLKKMPTLKRSAVTEQLKNLGAKCSSTLSKLVSESPIKSVVVGMGHLFDPRNVVTNEVDNDLLKVALKMPFLKELSAKEFLEGYLAFQSQVRKSIKSLKEGESVDLLAILESVKESNFKFVSYSAKAIWIPVANVDSERVFSLYGNVQSDLRTNLTQENLEALISLSFSARR